MSDDEGVISCGGIALQLLARDRSIMGDALSGSKTQIAGWISIALIVACISALIGSWVMA